MRHALAIAACVLLGLTITRAQSGTSILFVGNSFAYGANSPARFYRANTVTDLNNEGIGGVPALFKSFTQQAGLDYQVFLETRGGTGIDWHVANKRDVISSRGWDAVVLYGYSTLDNDKPRDPAKLIASSKEMADLLRSRNPNVQIYLTATWSRADQTYPAKGAWAGQPIDVMGRDIRAAYDKAASQSGAKGVNPVGDAWNRAMKTGVADANPYDGIEADKVDLWAYDHYHASAYGYYLSALVIFGKITGRDPRSLGDSECSGFELGLSRPQVKALQQVAFDELVSTGAVKPNPLITEKPVPPQPCAR